MLHVKSEKDILHESAKGRKSVQSMTYPKSSWAGKGALDIWTNMVFGTAKAGRTIPLPTGPSSLQFCLVTIAHGEISPIPNESPVAY